MAEAGQNSGPTLGKDKEPGVPAGLDDRLGTKHTHILRLIRLLWRGRNFLGWCVAVGFAVATVIAFLLPKRYESTTKLMPPGASILSPTSSSVLQAVGGALPSDLTTSILGIKTPTDLLIAVLRSDALDDRIIARLSLKKVYMAKYDFEARDALRGATVISEDIRSGVISISVQDRDPKRACDIAQAYVDELDNSVVKLNTSAAHRERVFIEQRLNSVKEGLDSASNKLGEFGSSNATMNPQEQGTLTMSTAAKIEEDLTVAQAELGGLEQVYTKDNTRVRELQARVGELEKKLQEIGGKGPIKSSDGVYPSIRELPLMAVTYDDLLRSTKLQAALYETLAKEYESAKIEEAKEIPSISMLDPPAIAERKSGPPRRAIIVGGTVAALLLGIICLLLPLAVVQIDLECVRYVIGNEAYAKLAVFVKRVEEWNGNG